MGVDVLDAVEDQSTSAVLDELRGGSCGFDDGAGWGEVAAQHGNAAFVQQRLASKPDHLRVPDGIGVQVIHEWTSSDGNGRRVEKIANLPQNCWQVAFLVAAENLQLAGSFYSLVSAWVAG